MTESNNNSNVLIISEQPQQIVSYEISTDVTSTNSNCSAKLSLIQRLKNSKLNLKKFIPFIIVGVFCFSAGIAIGKLFSSSRPSNFSNSGPRMMDRYNDDNFNNNVPKDRGQRQ